MIPIVVMVPIIIPVAVPIIVSMIVIAQEMQICRPQGPFILPGLLVPIPRFPL
jgi:hypothetical protein